MNAKDILSNLREILNKKRNEYIDMINKTDSSSPYYQYCKGKKDMIEDVMMFLANEINE